MTSPLEGRIRITLVRSGDRLVEARIASTRPQLAQSLLAGRTPEEAARLAGLVFSLCGRAQGRAAAAACAAARDETRRDPADTPPILAELAREHAWRLVMDWPVEAGEAPRPAALARLRQAGEDPRALADTLADILRDELLGEAAADWLARLETPAGLEDWLRAGRGLAAPLLARLGDGPDPGAGDTPLLPPLAELGPSGLADLARRALDEAGYCAAPTWQGGPAETGALARCQGESALARWQTGRGRGAGARLLARLLELARLPRRLLDGTPAPLLAVPLGPDLGAAGVETSRGLLVHVAQLAAGRVVQYRILAPTEWNFHPEGPLARALPALPPGPDLEARARLLARALDPCVDYGLEVTSR